MDLVIAFLKNNMRSILSADKEKQLADVIPEGIVVLDQSGVIQWWNRAAQQVLALDNKLHRQQPISRVIDALVIQRLRKNNDDSPVETFSINCPDTRLSVRLRAYLDDQYILILQDITQIYRLEGVRQDFIANVSHELRTPLTVFRGYLELLQAQADVSPEVLSEMVSHMSGQCRRMELLVQDLLLLSRLENHEPNVERHQQVNVGNMLKEICKDAKLLSGEKAHHFTLHIDDALLLDGQPEELRSAFSNLIYNAVHYTPAQGQIIVSWRQDETGKHMTVKDTGIGIAEKYIPRITQRFYRVDKARPSRDKGGTGLGLAIVKHVLLRHNGELTIHSKEQAGSTFCCSFGANT